MKKYVNWAIVGFGWTIAIVLGLSMAGGIAEGSSGWASLAVFVFAGLIHLAGRQIDALERRIARLEQAVGDHHRLHGHRTDY